MAYNYNYSGKGGGGSDNSELVSWIVIVAALVVFWPVGLFFLFRKLMGYSDFSSASSSRRGQSRHPYDIRQDAGGADGAAQETPFEGRTQSSAYSATSTGGQSASPYRYQYQPGQAAPGQQAGPAPKAGPTPKAAPTPGPQRKNPAQATPGMQGVPGYQPQGAKGKYGRAPRKPVNLNRGKGMMVWGSILTGLFGLAAVTSLPMLLMEEGLIALFAGGAPILGFLSLGIVLLATGSQRNKKAKRFRRYLALIGKRDSISISSLASAMPVSVQTACEDLQDMLDEGYISTGYLDMASGRLILSDDGLREEVPAEPEEAPEVEVEIEEEEERDDNAILAEIKQVNDSIADPDMNRKIERIGEITGKILDYQRKNPNRDGQLRSFLSYYLPTTLKILKAYSQMEAQGIEGENIRGAKQRIEGMMDKVVEGFEKQLDKLFQDDAMDITTDVEVLERMLDKDGLSGGGNGFQLGI